MSNLPEPNPPTDAGIPGTAFADRVIGGSKGYANKQASALLNALRYQGVEITQALEDAITAVGSEFYGASDPALDPDLTVTSGSVWADSDTGLIKRRNDTNDDWVVEGTLFKRSLPQYAEADTPTTNKGPIYVVGKGVREFDSGISAYTDVSPSLFSQGTRMLFAQAAAPTGWTQIVTDDADNRMLRVVKTAGAGVGGSHSPIINNVVPEHTHAFTTGNETVAHSHSGSTGLENASHSHYYTAPNSPASFSAGAAYAFSATQGGYTAATGTQTANHAHAFTTGTQSANHTHSGSTDTGSSKTNWEPRYIDIIICTKD